MTRDPGGPERSDHSDRSSLSEASERSATVLVVDDNPGLADLYAHWLSRSHEVRTAYDGRAAIERLDADIDVLLLDRLLPDVPGDAVLERARERDDDCLVAMVTGVPPDCDVLEMPVDEYVVKPVDREALERIVEDLLDRTGADAATRTRLARAARERTLDERASRTTFGLRLTDDCSGADDWSGAADDDRRANDADGHTDRPGANVGDE